MESAQKVASKNQNTCVHAMLRNRATKYMHKYIDYAFIFRNSLQIEHYKSKIRKTDNTNTKHIFQSVN